MRKALANGENQTTGRFPTVCLIVFFLGPSCVEASERDSVNLKNGHGNPIDRVRVLLSSTVQREADPFPAAVVRLGWGCLGRGSIW